MEDQAILALYRERSETALAETSRRYGAYLLAIASNLLHSREDAEEVVGDTYWRAWNSIPPAEPRSLKHYLSRITRNLALDRLDYRSAGKRDVEATVLLSELEECIPDRRGSAEERWEAKELGILLNRFLEQIPREDRALFLARYYYAATVRQIAAFQGIPERRVKYRLTVTRDKLKTYLEKEGVIL